MTKIPSTRPMTAAAAVALLALLSSRPLHGADVGLPRIHGKEVVATVNGEPITLAEYGRQFSSIHMEATDKEQVKKQDPAALLERLIKVALIVQEAENIGLDDLPEVQKALESFQQDSLRNLLFEERTRNITKGDPKEIDRIYKESVKEVKVASVLAHTEKDADSLYKEIKKAGDFAGPLRKFVKAGKGEGSPSGSYVKMADLTPEVARVVSQMKRGEVSPVIRLGNKFTILRLEAIRFPDDPAKRKEAEQQAVNRKRAAELRKYVSSLEKKYATINDNVVRTLDFEAAEPGLEVLLKDDRPVARIRGEEAVTVAELAEALQKLFFHGVEHSAARKRVNIRKDPVLEQIVAKRVVLKEARWKKLDQAPEYRERVGEFRKELLFGAFVQKVIDPESRVGEEELKTVYAERTAEYRLPERIRVDLLIFANRGDAEEAIGKLRDGADFQWVKANAPGQADPSAAAELSQLAGMVLPKSELPEDLRRAVEGAAPGDLRQNAAPDGLFHVIAVREVIPSRPEDYEKVKDRLAARLSNEKRSKALESWMEKLREAAQIEVYASGPQLRELLESRAW